MNGRGFLSLRPLRGRNVSLVIADIAGTPDLHVLTRSHMSYYISRTFETSDLPGLKDRAVAALKAEGFGVLTEIDLSGTLKQKIGKEHPPHLILGACNPNFAHQVVSLEPHISTLLPCNVTLRRLPDGRSEVAAIDPSVAMQAVGNQAIAPVAAQVRDALKRVLDSL